MVLTHTFDSIERNKNADSPHRKLAIMQPYFLPYLGYFTLIKVTDKWIVLDEVQMIQYGWVHRNRVLRPCGEFYYIKVPLVKHSHLALIKDVYVRNDEDWGKRIIDQLSHYKRRAPFYNNTVELLKEAFSHSFNTITEVNVYLLDVVCKYIGIDFNYEILSKSNADLNKISKPTDWAKNICHSFGYVQLVNPIGGRSLYCVKEFENEGIELSFLKSNLPFYVQKTDSFLEGLSIVDVMMFNSPEEINKMLDDYQIVR
jgi:WbqC-like protein family